VLADAAATVHTTSSRARPRADGPCAEALIDAEVARVVMGIVDPDPLVAGQGVELLRGAGVDVQVGVLANEVEAQLAPYLVHRRTGRPLVVLKLAATLDGATAAGDGTSQWITGPDARPAHRLRPTATPCWSVRARSADDPSLTVRLPSGEPTGRPIRACSDGPHPTAASTRAWSSTATSSGARRPRWTACCRCSSRWGHRGAPSTTPASSIGTSYLARACWAGRGHGLFAGPGETIADVWRGEIADVRRVGADVRIDMVPRTRPGAGAEGSD
jgi:diaminohydroxyphosphoribosylaminopyrimidine deaminase/5-amino-6-(5-phosphoribosylamino)uracil reductase